MVDESTAKAEVLALVRWDINEDCEDISREHVLTAELADDIADRRLIAGRP